MREIKFRGISKETNEFIFGYLSSNGESFYIGNHGENYRFDEVKKESICQFTGLHDRKGACIYENDIVKWDDCSNGEYWRFAVVQINPDIQFNCSLIEKVGDINNSSSHIFKLSKFAYEDTEKYLEIIGNIHQNPELLK